VWPKAGDKGYSAADMRFFQQTSIERASMHPQAKSKLVTQLQSLATNVESNIALDSYQGTVWAFGTGEQIGLPTPHDGAFLELVNSLANQQPWRERFSVKYIEECLAEILWNSVKNDVANLKDSISELGRV